MWSRQRLQQLFILLLLSSNCYEFKMSAHIPIISIVAVYEAVLCLVAPQRLRGS